MEKKSTLDRYTVPVGETISKHDVEAALIESIPRLRYVVIDPLQFTGLEYNTLAIAARAIDEAIYRRWYYEYDSDAPRCLTITIGRRSIIIETSSEAL